MGWIAQLTRRRASNAWVTNGVGSNPTEADMATVTKVMTAVMVQISSTAVAAGVAAVVVDLGWDESSHCESTR